MSKTSKSLSGIAITGAPGLLEGNPLQWVLGRLENAAIQAGLASPGRGVEQAVEVVLLAPDDVKGWESAGLTPPSTESESYSLRIDVNESGGRRISIAAADDRGYAYAIGEIEARIHDDGFAGLPPGFEDSQKPAVPVRGIQRNFSSVHEDSQWFHDRQFWVEYLDHLAAQRFNRFHLALGMQYNYGTGWESRTATDNYLVFAYPFLLDVPGYHVRAEGVSEADRNRNFDALAFIAQETRRRGMSFQLGLWNHAYDFGYDSKHWYPILGISPEIHADYSAAAVKLLLERIPEIDGVTFRVHHEGGVHEEGHEIFWGKVFDSMSSVGRPLEVDMHAKGVDQALLDAAAKPNIRTTISAKYWAEHMGLAYHQASIRQRERTPLNFPGKDKSITGVTDGARRFTRYGYADYLNEDRTNDVIFRMWPGTQKLLLWGDPALASGFGRYATFGGSRGVEFCEPLTFKGRRGTGEPGKRDPYERDDLRLGVHDWRKYRYTYALWGRLLYNPEADPSVWQRVLRSDYGDAAPHFEVALAQLSRVLPLVTAVHGVSGANNFYSPEMYVDLPISAWKLSTHYSWDTPQPATWEGVSPFDPETFYSIGEYADAALVGRLTPKYTPLEVASWIDAMVREGEDALAKTDESALEDNPQAQRTIIDLRIIAQLGRFFAGKFRAAVEYAFFRRTGDAEYLKQSIGLLQEAHAAYASIPGLFRGVYQEDIAFGVGISDRGSWSDRIMAMREDLHLLTAELKRGQSGADNEFPVHIERRSDRWAAVAQFATTLPFQRGDPFNVCLVTSESEISGAVLRYRHVNQAEDFETVEMVRTGEGFEAVIPGNYTASPYPLMYLAEVRRDHEQPVFVPAFNDSLSNQPYVVVHSSTGRTAE